MNKLFILIFAMFLLFIAIAYSIPNESMMYQFDNDYTDRTGNFTPLNNFGTTFTTFSKVGSHAVNFTPPSNISKAIYQDVNEGFDRGFAFWLYVANKTTNGAEHQVFDTANPKYEIWVKDGELTLRAHSTIGAKTATVTIVEDDWFHVGAIVNSSDKIVLVINSTNITVSTDAIGASDGCSTNCKLGLGFDITVDGEYFDGLMDDLRIFLGTGNTPTIEDFATIYNAGVGTSAYLNGSDGDTTPPEIILINATCEGGFGKNIFDSTVNNKLNNTFQINDTTCTFFVKTDEASTCAIINNNRDLNHTAIFEGNDNDDSGAPATTHTITLNLSNASTVIGFNNFSIGCKDSFDNENITSTSGKFRLNLSDPVPPKVDPDVPSDGAFFKVGINNTNIRFNISSTDNLDSIYNCTGYIDNVQEFSNATYANNTEFNFSKTVSIIGTHFWNVTCIDSFNNLNSSQRSFDVIATENITLFLDGINGTRKYEYPVHRDKPDGTSVITKRIANFTIIVSESTRTCITIDEEVNVSCNIGNWSYFFNFTALKRERIENGSKRFNMSPSINNITILMDNTSDILHFTLNLTGYDSSGFPEGIELDIDMDGLSDLVLPGILRDITLETNNFVINNLKKTRHNITILAGGSASFTFNATSVNQLNNFSIILNGNELDINNEFGSQENFSDSFSPNSTLTVKADAPLGFFDDFESNVTGRWIDTRRIFLYSMGNVDDFIEFDGRLGSQGENNFLNYDDKAADLRNTSILETIVRVDLLSIPQGTSLFRLNIVDGTSRVQIYSEVLTAGGSTLADLNVRNFTFIRISDDDTIWRLDKNGTNQGSTDISILDNTKQWKLEYEAGQTSGGSSAVIRIFDLKWGGVWLNRSTNNGTYQSTGNITSLVVNVTKNNVSRVTLLATTFEPPNTKIDFFCSNTCNATQPTFESCTSGVTHTFSSVGNSICWRAILNSSVNITSPIIRKVNLEIKKGGLENVSIDFGSTGDSDFLFVGTLNSSNSPIKVNGSLLDFLNFRTDNCLDAFTCQYPVTISAKGGGILEISEVNSTIKLINPTLNASKTVNKSVVNLSLTFINGILEMSGIDLNFAGPKNFTINATHSVNATILKSTDSHILQVLFSKFNRSLPYTFTKAIFPFPVSSVNDTNVSPFAQTDFKPIINVSGQAQQNFDIGIRINETNSCIQINALNNSNTSQLGDFGLNLTNTTKTFATNISKQDSKGIWLFFDLYNCNASQIGSIRGNIETETCCESCVRCWNNT